MSPKFKKRYILAEGYPWRKFIAQSYMVDQYNLCISQYKKGRGVFALAIFTPSEFDAKDNEVPKYRLVLERVK